MKTTDELQHDIEQFDFRCVRETKVRKERDGRLTIMHLPTRSTRQHSEIVRFRTFAEENWTIREIEHAASFHPAGVFRPHEDAEARITRTKIENTKDECLVEERTPAEVNYAGFGFATWAESDAFDKALRELQREALMLLGACAALGLYDLDFKQGFLKNNIASKESSAFDTTIVHLRHEISKALESRT